MNKYNNNYNIYYIVGFVIILVALSISIFTTGITIIDGQDVFGSTDFVGWNILIAAYVFLALTASGLCLTANFFEVLEIHRFQLLQKRAHFLAISILVPALGILTLDLGRIDRVFYFITSPNLASPMWWMGTVYGVYLLLLILEFWAIHNKKPIVKTLSFVTLFAAVFATSILGSIFAVIIDKPLWFGSGTPVHFIFSAVISGIAAMILGTILTYRLSGQTIPENMKRALKELGTILTVFLAIALVFTIWRLITVYFAGVPDTSYVIGGSYGVLFWSLHIFIGLAVPFLMLLSPLSRSQTILMIVSAMVLIGMYVDKHIFVLTGQFSQPYWLDTAAYTSTFVEWGIIAGGIATSLLIYLVGVKKLDLHETGHDEKEEVTAVDK